MATELGLLVRDGPKRATASLRSWYEQDGEPMPQPGDLSAALDGHGDPLCVIRTTTVEVRRFADVDEEFAWEEGRATAASTTGEPSTKASSPPRGGRSTTFEIVLERFELLWQPGG